MPAYEMPLLIRQMSRPVLKNSLKQIAQTIFSNGGYIRKIDNLGLKPLPVKAFYNNQTYTRAAHFIFYFDSAPKSIMLITDECNRNLDIIRCRVFKEEQNKQIECTLDEELQPAPYRKEVQEMLELEQKKREKKKYEYGSGLDYYPFQR